MCDAMIIIIYQNVINAASRIGNTNESDGAHPLLLTVVVVVTFTRVTFDYIIIIVPLIIVTTGPRF